MIVNFFFFLILEQIYITIILFYQSVTTSPFLENPNDPIEQSFDLLNDHALELPALS